MGRHAELPSKDLPKNCRPATGIRRHPLRADPIPNCRDERMIDTVTLCLFVALLSGGQLLFKQLGLILSESRGTASIFWIMLNPIFIGAMVLYGGATLLWIWILSRVPLSRAYPWVALGAVIVPLLSSMIFGEQTAPRFWIGVLFVVVGLVLTQLR
jgi:drug/metabolite transporter (DMT)-like permease